jgi:hypothetical protein
MKYKKFILLLFCFVLIFSLTGCMEKKKITSKKFISISKENKLNIYSATDQFKKYKEIKKCIIAANLRGWRVEFYELDNSDNAEKMFDKNKKTFEKEKNKNSDDASSNIRNYNTYSLTTSTNYYYLSRVDDTLVYVKSNISHKNDIKKFIDKLGY